MSRLRDHFAALRPQMRLFCPFSPRARPPRDPRVTRTPATGFRSPLTAATAQNAARKPATTAARRRPPSAPFSPKNALLRDRSRPFPPPCAPPRPSPPRRATARSRPIMACPHPFLRPGPTGPKPPVNPRFSRNFAISRAQLRLYAPPPRPRATRSRCPQSPAASAFAAPFPALGQRQRPSRLRPLPKARAARAPTAKSRERITHAPVSGNLRPNLGTHSHP